MTDVDQLRVRIARAVDPETWDGIDKMEAVGRDAPFLRAKSESSLTAATRVIDVLIDIGLEGLVAELVSPDQPESSFA